MDDIPEKAIQSQIMGVLRANGYYVQRMNSGSTSASYTYKRGPRRGMTNRRFIKAAAAGTPDIMAFKKIIAVVGTYAQLVFIEVKRPGKEPTMLQNLRMEELTDHGAFCMVATSPEEVAKKLHLDY